MVNNEVDTKTAWPGWSCQKDFNGEFDEQARLRMINGGKMLLPVLQKYQAHLNSGHTLEVGPFYNPLMPEIALDKENVTYLENDSDVCEWLKYSTGSDVIHHDIDDVDSIIESMRYKYKSLIFSQVINYINYDKLIGNLTKIIKNNSLLFINNVIDYGIEDFFSPNRPRSTEETLQPLIRNNFQIMEHLTLDPPKLDEQERMIIVAKYNKT